MYWETLNSSSDSAAQSVRQAATAATSEVLVMTAARGPMVITADTTRGIFPSNLHDEDQLDKHFLLVAQAIPALLSNLFILLAVFSVSHDAKCPPRRRISILFLHRCLKLANDI